MAIKKSEVYNTLLNINYTLTELQKTINDLVVKFDDDQKQSKVPQKAITGTNTSKNVQSGTNLIRLKNLKKDGNCAKCGIYLKKGWGAYWDKNTKKLYCSKCK